jgi:high-affinity nickel-transport protein
MTAKGASGQSIGGDDLLSDERIHVTGAGDIEAPSVHSLIEPEVQESKWAAKFRALSIPVSRLHSRIPFLKRLPSFVIFPITILILVNCLVWAITGIILRFHPYVPPSTKINDRAIAGPVTLAYTFGLRHALDADHIAAIDNVSRKLVALGQTPGTVGTFFRYFPPCKIYTKKRSLGHSTVVIIITIIVAATSAALAEKFDSFKKVGGIIGVSVSCSYIPPKQKF